MAVVGYRLIGFSACLEHQRLSPQAVTYDRKTDEPTNALCS